MEIILTKSTRSRLRKNEGTSRRTEYLACSRPMDDDIHLNVVAISPHIGDLICTANAHSTSASPAVTLDANSRRSKSVMRYVMH